MRCLEELRFDGLCQEPVNTLGGVPCVVPEERGVCAFTEASGVSESILRGVIQDPVEP